jgi:hypothetical protein
MEDREAREELVYKLLGLLKGLVSINPMVVVALALLLVVALGRPS